MTEYHGGPASERFLTVEERLEGVLRDRRCTDEESGNAMDFWLVRQPAFLATDGLSATNSQLPKPAAAVVSTDPTFITFLKLRLEYVLEGSFEAPSAAIPDALASTAA